MDVPSPFFTRHARAYAVSPQHARGADLSRLIALVSPSAGSAALDVATGTGHTAVALAEAGAEVVGLDPTPAMLEEARRLVAVRGLEDRIRLARGMAEALPFPDAAFDIVTCRRAAHHFTDLPVAVGEMARVLRRGGRLGLADLCPEAEAADAVNRLERLRDGTHVAALDEQSWTAVVRAAGLEIVDLELSVEETTFEAWLSPVAPDGPEAAAIAAALADLPAPTRRKVVDEAGTRWRKRRLILSAVRP